MRTICRVAFAVVLCGALVPLASCSSADQSTTPPAALSAPPPPASMPMPQLASFEVEPGLPKVPGNIATGARPPEMIRAAYRFAADHPEILKYMPCYCGCERMGHQGNDDCFVAKRDAKGKPSEWVTHGMICEVCLDIANEAMQMHNSGASVAAIRDAIERKHAGQPHTPTPAPPKTAGGGTTPH